MPTLNHPNLAPPLRPGDFSINYIIPIRPESIEHLEFQFDQRESKDSLKFVNAKVVKVHQVLELDAHILGKLIADLRHIVELHLNLWDFIDLRGRPSFQVLPAHENRLKVFHDLSLNQKNHRESKNNKSRVDIYMQGVLIQNNLQDLSRFIFKRLLLLHYHSYTRLPGRLPTICSANYLELCKIVVAIPVALFLKKYPNIEFVQATKATQPYPEQFLAFLTSLNLVTTLSIRFTGFEQDFYDRLAQLPNVRSLTTLILLDTPRIDFSFIRKFSLLSSFKTNLMPAEVVLHLLLELNDHGDYEFCFLGYSRLVLFKQKPDVYLLAFYKRQSNIKVKTDGQDVGMSDTTSSYDLEHPRLDDCAAFEEPLDLYAEKSYENLSLEKVAANFHENCDLLRHWYDTQTVQQSL